MINKDDKIIKYYDNTVGSIYISIDVFFYLYLFYYLKKQHIK